MSSPVAWKVALCDDSSCVIAWPTKVKRVLTHLVAPVDAERDGVHGIAHAVGDVLHGVGEVLLEVDGVVDGAVLRVDLLFLGDELLLRRSRRESGWCPAANGSEAAWRS